MSNEKTKNLSATRLLGNDFYILKKKKITFLIID